MLPISILFQHSLIYGTILSVMMSCLVLVALVFCPRIWLDRAPADIQQAAGSMTARDRTAKRFMGMLTLIGMTILISQSIVQLFALGAGHVSFLDVALSVFLIAQVFNVVDLLLIDWLLIATIRPSFVVLPGTEHLSGYRDYGLHFRGFLKGIYGSLIGSLIIAAITQGIIYVWATYAGATQLQ